LLIFDLKIKPLVQCLTIRKYYDDLSILADIFLNVPFWHIMVLRGFSRGMNIMYAHMHKWGGKGINPSTAAAEGLEYIHFFAATALFYKSINLKILWV